MNTHFKYKAIIPIIKGNIYSFIFSQRTICMFIFSFASTFVIVKKFVNILSIENYSINFLEALSLFAGSGFNGISMTSLIFLIMIAETPRQISFQQYSLIRVNRSFWCFAQVVYCCFTVVIMMIIIIGQSCIFLQPYTNFNSNWSDALRIDSGMDPALALVPQWIRVKFSPFQIFFLSLLPIFFFWFTMVLIVLMFSILGAPNIGIALYAFILFSDLIFPFELFPKIQSPIIFSNFFRISHNHENEVMTRLNIVLGGYVCIIILLVLTIMKKTRKLEIRTYSIYKE